MNINDTICPHMPWTCTVITWALAEGNIGKCDVFVEGYTNCIGWNWPSMYEYLWNTFSIFINLDLPLLSLRGRHLVSGFFWGSNDWKIWRRLEVHEVRLRPFGDLISEMMEFHDFNGIEIGDPNHLRIITRSLIWIFQYNALWSEWSEWDRLEQQWGGFWPRELRARGSVRQGTLQGKIQLFQMDHVIGSNLEPPESC